jgi:hypothetical protein
MYTRNLSGAEGLCKNDKRIFHLFRNSLSRKTFYLVNWTMVRLDSMLLTLIEVLVNDWADQ